MLKSIVADLSEVDEVVRPFYSEIEGKFQLNVEAVDGIGLEDTTKLKSALIAERTAKKALETKTADVEAKLTAYEGLDPSKARDALKKLEKFADFDPESEADKRAEAKYTTKRDALKGEYDSREGKIRSEADAKVADIKAQLDKRDAQFKHLLVDNVIKDELTKLHPLADTIDVVVMLAEKSVVTREVDGKLVTCVLDGNGEVRTTDLISNTPMTVAEFMSELRDKRPSLFKPVETKTGIGVGTAPNAPKTSPVAVNPWKAGSVNLTQQHQLLTSNPALAARLKAEASA